MKPNAVIVGAAKAGTTSLYSYLIKHPEVFLPAEQKEINYIAGVNQSVKTEADYVKLYEGAAAYKVRMDISTSYLYGNNAAQRIKDFLGPNTKIIIFVRNPVEAAFSLWKQMRHYGLENLGFDDALDVESDRKNDPYFEGQIKGWAANLFYVDRFKYMPQIQRYYDVFPADQIKIFIYEDFFNNIDAGWISLCKFLDIDDAFRPENLGAVYNPASGGYKSKFIHDVLNKRMAWKKLITWAIPRRVKGRLRIFLDDANKKRNVSERMSDETRERLKNVFYEDTVALGKFLNMSLPKVWLNQ